MPETGYLDIFATKGTEYLLVIGFLIVLVLFWRFLQRSASTEPGPVRATARSIAPGSWFRVPQEIYYHPGHSWALPGPDAIVTVGVDDFAQKLVGKPGSLSLPEVGSTVDQGERGWSFEVEKREIDFLSPVDGEVVALNREVLDSPDLINTDPYGSGWIMKVKASRANPNLRGLLHGPLAGAWMEIAENALRREMSGDLGFVMQDGGLPVTGIARSISGDNWDELVRDFLLTR